MTSMDSLRIQETKAILSRAEVFEVYDNVVNHNYAIPVFTISGAFLSRTKYSKRLALWLIESSQFLWKGHQSKRGKTAQCG